MKPPAISVIIPAYNAERYLGEAITSILDQTLRPSEVIVIDDGSTDATRMVVGSFGKRVRYEFQENSGAGAARNHGVEVSHGEFLSFLDADDLWVAEKLEWQWQQLSGRRDRDLIFGLVRQFVSPDLDESERNRFQVPAEAMPGHLPSTMLARREAFLRIGGYETDVRVGEVVGWYLRAREAGLRMHMLPEVVLHRRIHGSNLVIRQRGAVSDYARLLKASLDRRRAKEPSGNPE